MEGEESQLFEFMESFLPLKNGEEKIINKRLDLTDLFPDVTDFYSYDGSLTTPPCTENVKWVVFKNPIFLSLEEVLELKNNMPLNNYRNEQPINDRIIYHNLELQ
jgi:carbonic anhydrase